MTKLFDVWTQNIVGECTLTLSKVKVYIIKYKVEKYFHAIILIRVSTYVGPHGVTSCYVRHFCLIYWCYLYQVPDRGGRAYELEPPPPEMPSFMKRQDQPQQQRQGGRGGR